MKFRIFLAAAVSLAAAVMGAAASPAHAQMKKQLAVVPFKATPDIKQMAELCNVAARDEASKNSAVGMVDNTEIAARLDLEGKNVAGCSDDAECIIANGDALGVDGVLYGSLGKEADLVSVTVKLYLVKERREDRTFQARLAGEPPDIAALVARATLALITGAPLPEVSAPPPAHDRVITASNPGPGIAPGGPQVSHEAPPPASGKGRLWTWVAMGGEGAFLALGVTFHVLAYKTDEGIKAGGKSREELDSAISSGNTQILLSRIFYGLAVAGAGATVFLFYWEGEPSAKDSSASRFFKKVEPQFGVTPDGAGYLGLGGTF